MSRQTSPFHPSPPGRLRPLLLPDSRPSRGPRLFWTLIGLVLLLSFSLISLFPHGILMVIPSSVDPNDPPWMAEAQKAVALVRTTDSQGTGFNILPQGLLVTAHHVAQGCTYCVVNFVGGPAYRGTVLLEDATLDVAFLDLKDPPLFAPATLPYLSLVDSTDGLERGQPVYMIGNPEGKLGVVTRGTFFGWNYDEVQGYLMLLDIPALPGNSGSPVLNGEGQVVGMAFAVVHATEGAIKILLTVALPVEALWDMVDRLR